HTSWGENLVRAIANTKTTCFPVRAIANTLPSQTLNTGANKSFFAKRSPQPSPYQSPQSVTRF
ncbi:MAG: hypothetical protein F6K24_01035, partial [Okeania sp. SIO2D1]|nr:hypothetical protein [Okeania sp. SIO2D1]